MRRTKHRGRRGAAAVEFAVLLPFLLFLAVIATDWARLLYYTISIEACARAGALYAADDSIAAQSPYTNLQDHARAEAPVLGTAVTVTKATTTVNGRNGVAVTATYSFSTLSNFPGVPRAQTLTRTVVMRRVPITVNP